MQYCLPKSEACWNFPRNMFSSFFQCIAGDDDRDYSSTVKKNSNYPWRKYTLKELLRATNNFHKHNKIGEGGYGSVYWGQTRSGVEIAVKRLKSVNAKAEMEFAVEVEVLARVRHKSLLSLRGFYAGGEERLIVYDYMPNQSLLTHLHGHLGGRCLLDWRRRMKIVIGAAEGLLYLHHEANPHIIHRDIKASNVLLDKDFEAKVADFGFAKLIPDGVSHLTTRVKGTVGYLAPEYAMWGKVAESCDVYSYGILLLEIISGKKPLQKLPCGVKLDIVQWVTTYAQREAFDYIVDRRLQEVFDFDQLRPLVLIALRCTNANPGRRPSMIEVVDALRGGGSVRKRMISLTENVCAYDVENESCDDDISSKEAQIK